MSTDYGHAALLAAKPTWLATAYAEIAAETDVAALINFHTAGVAASFVAMSGRSAA